MEDRRSFLRKAALGAIAQPAMVSPLWSFSDGLKVGGDSRSVPIALVQFDSVPEQAERNRDQMDRLVREAVRGGARWVVFHENTVGDYTGRVQDIAEDVPSGPSTVRMAKLAASLRCYIGFGLSERNNGKYHISHVFVGPQGFIYCYRKTWLWLNRPEVGYRNEWSRYDPGSGPVLFEIDGVKATCFICADGASDRCLEIAADLHPQVVFYPNNRAVLRDDYAEITAMARKIVAPMLVTNRVGPSWKEQCVGGSAVYSARGDVLAQANSEGREEILHYMLKIEPSAGNG